MKRMDPLGEWHQHEASWWQFWYPQSGCVGGLLMGLVIGGVLVWMGVRL